MATRSGRQCRHQRPPSDLIPGLKAGVGRPETENNGVASSTARPRNRQQRRTGPRSTSGFREHAMAGVINGPGPHLRGSPRGREPSSSQRLHATGLSGWPLCPKHTSSTRGLMIRGLGEMATTNQPVEQIAAKRACPDCG